MTNKIIHTSAFFDANGLTKDNLVNIIKDPKKMGFMPTELVIPEFNSELLEYDLKYLDQFLNLDTGNFNSLGIGVNDGKNIFGGCGTQISWQLIEKTPDEELINFITINPKFYFMYSHPRDDEKWQNEDRVNAFREQDKDTQNLKLIYDKFHGENKGWKVDISKNPGKRFTIKKPYFNFMSSWRMWFGKSLNSLFDREKLLSFEHAHKIQELDSGTIFIELYKDPFSFNNKENREIQKLFKEYINIEKIFEEQSNKK